MMPAESDADSRPKPDDSLEKTDETDVREGSEYVI